MGLPRELAVDVQEAWHRFIERTEPLRPDLHRYCRSLTGSTWDAEDLVQDTLLRAFAKLGEIQQEIVRPKAYLLRIASNLWIDRMRRPEAPAPEPIRATEEPSRGLEVRDAAREVMRRLSPQERAAFVLKDLFDLRIEELRRSSAPLSQRSSRRSTGVVTSSQHHQGGRQRTRRARRSSTASWTPSMPMTLTASLRCSGRMRRAR